MHLSTLLPTLLLPLLVHAIPPYPGYEHPSFSLQPYGVEFTNGQCANNTYPPTRPQICDVEAAIATLQSGVMCASAPDAAGCNLIASYGDARISLCGFGAPQDCGGVIKQAATVMTEQCGLGDNTVGAWTRSRSGNGVVIWHTAWDGSDLQIQG